MLLQRKKTADKEVLELLERLRVHAAHHFQIFPRQFERRGLEVHGLVDAAQARGIAEDEAVVDVDEVAVGVDQDVGVVAVAHLEQVRDKAAARHATSDEAEGCTWGGRRGEGARWERSVRGVCVYVSPVARQRGGEER